MASKKKYRIYCNTCAATKDGWTNLDDPPSQCPVNAGHSVVADSKAVTEVLSLDNLSAITDPTINDDINDGYVVGSRWINTQTKNEFVNVDNTAGAAVWTVTRKDVFGTEYNYAASEDEASTTSGSWQERTTLTVTLPAGNYMVAWNWEQKGAMAKAISARVMLDDITELSYMWFNYYSNYYPFSGMAQTSLTAGSHTFCIEHCSPNSATTSYIRRARIAIWRVG